MAHPKMANRVRDERTRRGWSQQDLAARSGLSRAEISAIETGRVVPSTVAALAVGAALGCRVESLFRLGAADESGPPAWAWPSGRECRYWLAEVGGRALRFPVEPTAAGPFAHDGVGDDGPWGGTGGVDPGRTLVLAGCDPAAGLVGAALARSDIRVLPLIRSSGRALHLLRDGRVHVAGLHLGDGTADNDAIVKRTLGPGYRRIHIARWREGLALAPGLGHSTIGSAISARLRWVEREDGSGARGCQDLILEGRPAAPDGAKRIASDHRGVVETIRTGWAQAGVCVELAAVEGGLDFMPARAEDYDLCFAASFEDDLRLVALLDVLRSRAFAKLISELPGYDASRTGELS